MVARAEPVVVAETRRLLAELRERKIPVRALVVNSRTPPGCKRCRAVANREAASALDLAKSARGCAIIHAPLVVPPPNGAGALLAFRATWRDPSPQKR